MNGSILRGMANLVAEKKNAFENGFRQIGKLDNVVIAGVRTNPRRQYLIASFAKYG